MARPSSLIVIALLSLAAPACDKSEQKAGPDPNQISKSIVAFEVEGAPLGARIMRGEELVGRVEKRESVLDDEAFRFEALRGSDGFRRFEYSAIVEHKASEPPSGPGLRLVYDTPCGEKTLDFSVEKRGDFHAAVYADGQSPLERTTVWVDAPLGTKVRVGSYSFTVDESHAAPVYDLACASAHEVELDGRPVGSWNSTRPVEVGVVGTPKPTRGWLIPAPDTCYRFMKVSYSSDGFGPGHLSLRVASREPAALPERVDFFLQDPPGMLQRGSPGTSHTFGHLARTECHKPERDRMQAEPAAAEDAAAASD